MRQQFVLAALFGYLFLSGFPAAVSSGQDDLEEHRERDRRESRERIDDEGASGRRRELEWQLDANRAVPHLQPPVAGESLWFLGITVTYQETGAECTAVVPRSPARRSGLEARDLIVAVNGYQVGHVSGRLYPLERELELRADRLGRVRLLVQDHRTGRLANVDVRLEPARRDRTPVEHPDQLLIGTVTSRHMTRLAPGAMLVVSLVDITDRLSSLQPIAQRTFNQPGPFPIPFELPYDPERMDVDREYALRAYVTIHGITSLSTRDIYPVRPDRPPGRIRLELEPVR
jgi:uncharacterized lipoprotein YbaY